MTLAPERASLGLTIDIGAGAITWLGIQNFSITDKTAMKEITCDADTAVRRMPLLDDADAKLTVLDDPADVGMIAARTAKAAHTLCDFVGTKGSKTYTFSAYIQDIGDAKGPADERSLDITLAVSGGVVVS